MAVWRLIQDPPLPGAWNLAVDLAILEAYRSGEAPATLRLYDWQVPTLSLGYAQSVSDVDLAACAARGVSVVRRSTGGRAVLHGAGDLTYAVIASEHEGFDSTISGTYRRISEAIAVALSRLGLEAELSEGSRSTPGTSACFSTGTRADLLASGHKLVGSAQLRRQGGFLQHGALMLTQEPDAIRGLLVRDEAPSGMTNLQRLLGLVGADQVRAALVAGLAEAFDVEWDAASLSPDEMTRARSIAESLQLA